MTSPRYNAWIVQVIEIDKGLRSPDGFVICLELEEGKKFVAAKKGKVYWDSDNQYSEARGDFKPCLLSPSGLTKLNSHSGLVWIGDNSFRSDVLYIGSD